MRRFICFLFGTCYHKWEYRGEVGITYQQKRCKKCGKLVIETQLT